LDSVDVDPGDPSMQDIVINSFYDQCELDNDDEWEEKIAFATIHFDVFSSYIQEVWLSEDKESGEFSIPTDDDFNIAEINTENLTVIDLAKEAKPYFWHLHPDSDECFLVIEGILIIELENETFELRPNQLFTIPRNVMHRTRPKVDRVVNLTFESGYTTTVKVDRY